jgi:pimeloyl-ACP methyl ester carboxylesterase
MGCNRSWNSNKSTLAGFDPQDFGRRGLQSSTDKLWLLRPIAFPIPWQLFTGNFVGEITRQIRHTLARNKGANCSIIAHSFGTFVVARILRDHTDLEFDKIIFCGSVVPHKFRFEDYRGRFEEPLINEVGTKDFWPVITEVVTIGYGSAGTYGKILGAFSA